MRPKTKALADKILTDPKISHTQAYIDTHETTNRTTAKFEASRLLKKESVKVYMKAHEDMAKQRIAYLSVNGKKEDIQLKAAQDILDRNVGKAVQRQETQNTNLNLNLEVSKDLSDKFTQFIKQQTQV